LGTPRVTRSAAALVEEAPVPVGEHFVYHECKVAVLGKTGVGKTAVVARLCQQGTLSPVPGVFDYEPACIIAFVALRFEDNTPSEVHLS
jgi:GTPase SAR1 family protein